MTERSERQVEIVSAMIEDALISANEFERDCAAFAESQKIDEMMDVIEELSEWIEERDADRLEELGEDAVRVSGLTAVEPRGGLGGAGVVMRVTAHRHVDPAVGERVRLAPRRHFDGR